MTVRKNRQRKKREKIKGSDIERMFLLFASLSSMLILFAGHFFVSEEESRVAVCTGALVMSGIWIAYDFSVGVVKTPKNLEALWVIISSAILLLLDDWWETAIMCILFLFIRLLVLFAVNDFKKSGVKFGLSPSDFKGVCEQWVKLANLLIIPMAIILGAVSFFLNKEEPKAGAYSLALAFLALSPFRFCDLLSFLSYFSMIRLTKKGIYLSSYKKLNLKHFDAILMEDEGVLTDGKYEVSAIVPLLDYTKEELIELSAYAFYNSENPDRECFINAYGKKIAPEYITDFSEDEKLGVSLTLADDNYRIGRITLMHHIRKRPLEPDSAQIVYYILKNGEQIGTIELISHISGDLTNTVERLKSNYADRLICFLGRNSGLTKRVCAGLGIETLSVNDKQDCIKLLEQESVGDLLYINGSDLSEACDVSKFSRTVSARIGKSLDQTEDYDAWIPNGSLDSVHMWIEEGNGYSSAIKRSIILFIVIKIAMAVLVMTGVAKAALILGIEMLFLSGFLITLKVIFKDI